MTSVLIEPNELAEWLSQQRELVILDARARLSDAGAGRSLWREGHIPGAIHADLDVELAAVPSDEAGRHPLPAQETFAATLRGWGVTPERPVVVYDDTGGRLAAARAWWMLRWAGHPAVYVLNGGWRAWSDGHYPITTEAPCLQASDWVPAFDDRLLATADDVAVGGSLVLDGRATARFRGDEEPIDPVAGHIPGACNVPGESLLDSRAAFLSAAELAATLPAEQDTIASCGSGVTACQLILAYAVIGRPLPRLFVGSWSAWSRDPQRPVATGTE